MKFSSYKKIVILLLIILLIPFSNFYVVNAEEGEEDISQVVERIFKDRSLAILNRDLELIEQFYDTDTKYGRWAYEYQEKKTKYIINWAEKQGVKFTEINPHIVIRKAKNSDEDVYSLNILCSMEYKYSYEDEPEISNKSRIGSYHVMTLAKKDGNWLITKEWYNDPFADSLDLENIKSNDIKQHIISQPARDMSNLNERRVAAVEYAKMYCGSATEPEFEFKYNKKYRNFNPEGGDCANFASQILHEGGKFKKNSAWNYDKGSATGPWVNADKFTHYMLNSGRASVIARGSYENVYKASYKLLPGDFIAYEKKGDITHISVVTGADSKGYSLVSCHNVDRNDVPWDLGWSDKKIRFWLVRVHY